MTVNSSRRVTLSVAGFLATAIAFGPARMGFGLFLPVFRDNFQISTGDAGLISSAAFTAFLLALPIGIAVLNKWGPRVPVFLGGISATAGLTVAAFAHDITILATGIIIAAASAGFCWTPYNNAAERIVEREKRARTLSIISTGTTIGSAAAGILALAVALSGLGWRVAWCLFATGAFAMTLINFLALRPVAHGPGQASRSDVDWRALLIPETRPLAIAALSFGLTSSIYLSFAIDHATTAGALTFGPLDSAAPLLFVSFGIIGLVGAVTAEIENRIGLVALLWAIFLASALSFGLMAFMQDSGWAVLASAGLQGAVVMMTSAVFSFWTARLFPYLPSVSFTGVLIVVALGSVLGPVTSGWAGDMIGLKAVFIAGAAISLVTPFMMNSALIDKASARPWRPGTRSRTIYPAPE